MQMVEVQSAAAVAAAIGCFSSFLAYVVFVHRVNRYAKAHGHRQAMEFAEAIRPGVVAAVAKIATGRPHAANEPEASGRVDHGDGTHVIASIDTGTAPIWRV